jgi:hypothetical protein
LPDCPHQECALDEWIYLNLGNVGVKNAAHKHLEDEAQSEMKDHDTRKAPLQD